ncbi:EamA family transporter [Bacillus sp. FJAT-47783]|uniref:EamA family transporter n=1 Tax=Bacillus sp. FJAT-47783 TaxID=2922712 RepID=UPI001FABD7C3|nr:EamA family transporter [Bacillus sp. FJAT-47783]
MKRNLSFVLILCAAVLWGTTGTTQAFAPEHTNPISFGTMRLVFGGATMLLFVLLQRKLFVKNWRYKYALLAAISMACYQPLFFTGVKLTGIAVGTVVGIGSAPILAGLLEWLFRKKKPKMNWYIATFFALSGCIMLFGNQSSLFIDPLGIALSIGAGLSFAVYTIISKELLETHTPDVVVAVVFSMSACFLLPFLFFTDLTWLFEFRGLATSLYLGVFATGFAYLLFAKGLSHVPSSTAVTLTLAEPLTATLLGAFIIGEALSFTSWVGIALLLMAIIILSMTSNKQHVQQVTVVRD